MVSHFFSSEMKIWARTTSGMLVEYAGKFFWRIWFIDAIGATVFQRDVKSEPSFHCFNISARASRGMESWPEYSPKTRTVFFSFRADSQMKPPAEGAMGSEPS